MTSPTSGSLVMVRVGDCRTLLKELPDNSIDSIVTDPPYELGFMGKSWDSSGIAYDITVWQECLRVLKPGGHLLAFGGSRTYHRLACAVEDAGFQIRDQIMWVYGSGFPKSHNVSIGIDKQAGVMGHRGKRLDVAGNRRQGEVVEYPKGAAKNEPATAEAREWEGYGTALKPAHEPIVLARKPLDGTVANNTLVWGVGGLNIDGCRVGDDGGTRKTNQLNRRSHHLFGAALSGGAPTPIGAGRFPANFIHDGSDEVLELFPDTKPSRIGNPRGTFKKGLFANPNFNKVGREHEDSGSAARFFYCAKANKRDRNEGLEGSDEKRSGSMVGNVNDGDPLTGSGNPRRGTSRNGHPTVKPTTLMRYLCRLVTPPNGTILDPFTGSGSTGKAAVLEGFNFVGIELSQEYADIANARISHAQPRR